MTKKKSLWRRMWDQRAVYAMYLPYMLLFVTFTVVPVLISVGLSLTYFNVLQAPSWVGLTNYINLFMNDGTFLIALKNTFILACITGPLGYLMCFGFAWCINELHPLLRTFYTFAFYSPSISGNAYLIFTILFSSDRYGFVNGWLIKLGLIDSPIQFFTDTKYMLGLCILVILWSSLGTSLLVFIAGFQGVDRSLYEAGAVDGITNRFSELWYITLPVMKPQLMLSAVLTISSSFGVGSVITGLVGFPSTNYAAHTIMHHLEDYGNMRFEMGYASAIATFLFVIMLAANSLIRRLLNRVGK